MGFSTKVSEAALVATGRHCALCHKYCGTKIELHHVVPVKDGGDDSFDNCIPLCFDCHADVEHYNPKHPKGRRFTPSELKEHRDRWYARNERGGGEPLTGEDGTEGIELDRATYARLREILPSDGSISFLRTNNYAGFSFPLSKHRDLEHFVHHCDNHPEFEFLDPDLEGLKADLRSTADELLVTLAANSWPVSSRSDDPRNSIPEEWEITQPERFQEVVDHVHSLTGKIVESYDSLVRLARRRLGDAEGRHGA